MGMANLELKDIFEKERLPKSNWQFLSLMLYSPIGLCLSLLRFFIGLHACLAALILRHTPLIRSIVLRMLCPVLGITVKQDNKQEYVKSVRIIVANCVTQFDHIALHLVTNCVTPSRWEGSFFRNLIPGLAELSDDDRNLAGLRSFVEKGDAPVLLHPEGTTSGKSGVLKFNTVPAQVSRKVQPVAVWVERPVWANTAPTVLGASLPLDLFWFLFSPYTIFRIKYLSILQRESEETDEEFSNRMQSVIANSLSLPATSFTASDKAEYEKRYLDELNRPVKVSSPIMQTRNPELLRMVIQVSEVLPHVPHEAIINDLNRTWSVETTISNILEGLVQYSPISQALSDSGQARSHSSLVSATSQDSLSSKPSPDWMLSFSERKAKMIEEARRRYIEKKGLKDIL